MYIYDIRRVDTNGDTRYNTYILRSLIHVVWHWPRLDCSGMIGEVVNVDFGHDAENVCQADVS